MRLPVVMQLHPSWLMYHHFYVRLACALLVVVVAVELPLAPERRLPAHIDTSVDALRQLHSIALSDAGVLSDLTEELLRTAADFSRVFLIRDSSGGNIVGAHVCEDGEDSWVPLRVAGCIPLHPGFVRATRSKSELELRPDSVLFTLYMLEKFLAMVLPEGATEDHPYTCLMGPNAPLLESVPLPPLLVVVAEHDLIRDTNLEYCDTLRAAGKDVEVLFKFWSNFVLG